MAQSKYIFTKPNKHLSININEIVQNSSQKNSQSCVALLEKRGQSRTKLWEFFHIGLKTFLRCLPIYMDKWI